MPTGEALAALGHHVRSARARPVRVGLPVREAAVEEVWAWPAGDERGLNMDPLQFQKLL